ncbi:TSUP family transporter [Streptosporangium sp. NPDC051022]|uniref:TSUP family transporter n=1 Tax=Streptosporangium sp. NPDC051022 TaxID=3155752 RepID=UPI00341FCFD5
MSPEKIALLLSVAAIAGWIDAVVGGGGLLQVPVLLLMMPGMPVATALGTSKLAAIAGTSTAAITYARRTPINYRLGIPAACFACVAAGLGAYLAGIMPSQLFRPVIIAILVGVAIFLMVRPTFGMEHHEYVLQRRHYLVAIFVVSGGIGFYDGFIGPGTGTFLILSFVALLGLDLVRSSALAKLVNTGTNISAITIFALNDHIMWLLGAGMAVMNIAGAWVGAGMTLKRGAKFARMVLFCIVLGLAIRLAFE